MTAATLDRRPPWAYEEGEVVLAEPSLSTGTASG
jgi:hypothetical protein